MKIIDLLNKIANGEEVPGKIYYDGNDYKLVEYGETTKLYQCLSEPYELINIKTDRLNEELEIIEEKKIPEKLNLDKDELLKKVIITAQDYVIEGKINEIIDYLKSKGE